MKKLLLLTKMLLAAALLCVGQNAWGDEVVVPTPVYFNDFSFATSGSDGIEIVGNGQFEDDEDARFGRIFHNDPTGTKAKRTNYLKLPADILSHSGTTKEMTIGFWVNMKDATDFYFSPMFTAYDRVERASKSVTGETDASWPKFVCLARKLVDINCWGYCDLGNTYNDKGTNAEASAWLDDKAWHYYTITLTSTTVKVYIDGVIENSWTVDGTTAGQVINGIFDAGAAYNTNDYGLKYICLGGNQSDNYNDPDPAFGFDDFAVYNVALSKAQIDQIRDNKLKRSATGTKVGKQDNSTEYVTTTSEKVTLKPGESYHYNFINYNNGSTNHNNWILPVYDTSDARVISVRADNYEDMHHVGEIWGSNAGCTSDFNWTNFPGNINGATVDMTVTFTKDKVFNMSSTINTVDGSTWHYSYTNDYTDSPISLTSNDYIKVALSVSRSWLDIISQGYSAVAATIGSNGFTTFASPYPLDLTAATQSANGFTAYRASTVNSTTATFKDDVNQNVEANTGILLKGTAGAIITIPVVASGSALADNALKVNAAGTVFDKAVNTKYYGMNKDVTPLTFGEFDPSTVAIPANKAYLTVATGGGARAIVGVFGDITGVENVEAAPAEAKAKDGKFIENGKLVIVKNGQKFNAAGQQVK